MASNECNPYLPGVDVVEPCPSPSADVEAVASDVASAADAKRVFLGMWGAVAQDGCLF